MMPKFKFTRRHLFQLVAIVLVLILGVVMYIVGKQHTILLDNKTLEAGGKTYQAFSIVEVEVNRGELLELAARDRDKAEVMGQKNRITVVYTDKSFGEHKLVTDFSVPLEQDMVLVNIPALVGGADESVWMQPYEVPTLAVVPEAEPVVTEEIIPTSF